MKKAYRTLIIIIYIVLTFTPSLVLSQCNQDFTICSLCSNGTASSLASATYNRNLQDLLSFTDVTLPENGYYNKSKGKEPEDLVTVAGYCRGDDTDQRTPGLCKTCFQNISAAVLRSCPGQKEAVIWAEGCMLRYSNDSSLHLMEQEPLQILVNTSPMNFVDSETFSGRLKFLLDKLIQKASSSAAMYASGSINITDSEDIYSLVQCMPSLSQQDCRDCLHNSSSMIPGSVIGARILKASCTLRYETNNMFYTETQQTFNQPSVDPPQPSVDPPQSSQGMKKIVIGVVSTVIGVVVLIIGTWIFLKMRKNKSVREKLLEKKIGSIELSQLDFNDIRMAIEDFSDKNKLGQGGFGPVYKGRYNGQDIAVKRLAKTSQQGDLEFENEVKLVANLQHRNLVRLLGFCLDKMERLLIYECVPNSSLDKFIFDSNNRANMDWNMRYKIIEGIARGIIYLHEDSNLRIIHRDLKASNILLDEKMEPKISDFGMARLFGGDQTHDNTNRIVGTYGYMAPEYAFYGHFSIKSDVFSFGVLLLEIVSGQKNNPIQHDEEEGGDDLLTYAWKSWRDRNYSIFIDPIIFECSRTEEIIRCVHIGLLCVQENPTHRPTMKSILHMLNNHSEALAKPSKPALFESTYIGSVVTTLNNSKSGSAQEATNIDEMNNSKSGSVQEATNDEDSK